MTDKEKKKEEKKEELKCVELQYIEIAMTDSEIYKALDKLFDKLYFGIDEGFAIKGLKDAVKKEQDAFEEIRKKAHESVFGKNPPNPEDIEKLPKAEKERVAKEHQIKNIKFNQEFVQLLQKKTKIEFTPIKLSKETLNKAMDRELEKGDKGVLITADDLSVWSKFIDFE